MSRPTPPPLAASDDRAARAFARVGAAKLSRALCRFAIAILHLAGEDAVRVDRVVDAVEIVNMLFLKAWEGKLTWTLPEDATDEEIVREACKKLFTMRSNLRRQFAVTRRADDRALKDRADDGPDALELLVERANVEEVVRLFGHDSEAASHVARMLEGKERGEIKAELGCDEKRADAVHKRITRFVAKLGFEWNIKRETAPRGSGSQGSDHAQATEERSGAPAEPRRSAGGAGRRR